MAAQRFEDLEAWQLADALKKKVYELIDSSTATADGRFCSQLRGAVSSATANLAEGFGYYEHALFGRHVRIAKASLDETCNHLKDGVDRRFWTADRIETLLVLADHASGKCVRLAQYLARTNAPPRWPNIRRRSR